MATKQTTGEATIEDLAAQMDTIRADIATLTSQISKVANDEMPNARAKVRDAASALSDKGERLAGAARDQADASTREVEAAIQRNPFGAVLVASHGARVERASVPAQAASPLAAHDGSYSWQLVAAAFAAGIAAGRKW